MTASKNYSSIVIEFDDICDELEDIVDEEVHRFHSVLYETSPVDSGNFKRSWTTVTHDKGSMTWTFENEAPYASILARKRTFVNGRWYGSNKNGWGGGIKPFANRFEKRVERRTDNVRN